MCRCIGFVGVLLVVVGVSIVFAGELQEKPVKPRTYPGGSPFAPGEEPDQTHTVNVFWTTEGEVVTLIDVATPGGKGRPTQAGFAANSGDGGRSTIAPTCDYHYRVAATKPEKRRKGYRDQVRKGHGTFTVRVFGRTAKDFATPPKVHVRYLDKTGKVIGQTNVVPHALPKKLRPKPTTRPTKPAPKKG